MRALIHCLYLLQRIIIHVRCRNSAMIYGHERIQVPGTDLQFFNCFSCTAPRHRLQRAPKRNVVVSLVLVDILRSRGTRKVR